MDRDKTDAVVLNADVLFPVPTALVRRAHIDRADQLMQDIAIQLLDTDIGSRFFNEPLKMIVLCFLYFDFLPQSGSVGFQLLLLCFIGLAEHLIPFIAQSSCRIILIYLDEQTLELEPVYGRADDDGESGYQHICEAACGEDS